MLRTTAFAAGLIGWAACASPAGATEGDTQFWMTASAEAPLAGGVTLSADASQRFRSPAAGDDIQLYRAGIQVAAANWIALGGGIADVESDSADETRLFQSVTLKWGKLLSRSQLEERFFEGAARPQLRGRQRFTLTVPLDRNDRLQPYVELNYILRNQNPAVSGTVDHWRVKLDWRHKLTPHLELSASYMILLAPRPAAEDRLSHVPSLALLYAF
ncbi:MAG: DUF2490 domain-containing protein [Candidatus Andeanibacterium colombiense]|uniref:DUF2490 domain-containing protein n=1 Tax=Candidatus Andeanibacterium colombiense TaxID=3121345 RepID=A0AAJ5X4I8_9SPHN|nr:MAG: DUF2490 domain-containing protein [Sphingomonadaceae bacterium]